MAALKMMWESIKIIARNKLVFSTIMVLTTLPLSALTLLQSISTHPLSSQVHTLEHLARLAPTRFESRHVWHQSRLDALSLLRLRALFSLPSYLLSLAAALSSVHSSLHPSPSLRSVAAASAHSWHRPFLTSLFVYAILFAFSPVPILLGALTTTSSPGSRFVALAIGSGVEVYLMAVLSLALVVSVAEERFGWEAIRVGHALMEGRRFCAWVLTALLAAVSGLIGSEMEALVKIGQTGFGEKAILVFGYALLVLWSYVIITAFYCDCRKRHPIKEPLPDNDHHQLLELSP